MILSQKMNQVAFSKDNQGPYFSNQQILQVKHMLNISIGDTYCVKDLLMFEAVESWS